MMIPAELADDIWDLVKNSIPEGETQEMAQDIVRIFEAHDCDDLDDTEVFAAANPDE